ncbi:MAG: PBSX family phage terminase large subunit [Acutalibacteraceae bacterium]
MNFVPFSRKQLTVLTWWCCNSKYKSRDAVICDGAVRSGKTLCMSLSFVLWALSSFDGACFAICGKTVSSLRRNVITPLIPALKDLGFECSLKTSKNLLEIKGFGKTALFYLFGGKDESSASLIQGVTLAGVMLDEVALMPRSFVEQALARCSVTGSKMWFNCNPENPYHWFYREWILKSEQKNALYLHFTMKDNPSLSKDIIRRYETLYSGVFYERFVEGKWVAAEGLVYPFFDLSQLCAVPKDISEYHISCDYGTVNPFSLGLWGKSGGTWYRIAEYYYSSKREGSQKTDEEYYSELLKLAGERKIESVIVDPSAASFIEVIRRHGKYKPVKAENDVISGIRQVGDAIKSGKIKICKGCGDTVREFSLYRWDESASSDKPLKQNDHAMDDIRYFTATVLNAPDTDGFAVVSRRRENKF